MNYTVHSIMYFYFGLTQCGPKGRRVAKRFAMLITIMQLTQMVVGILVTLASVYYHAQGEICYTPLFNSAMGLVMYASYFVLFLQARAAPPSATHAPRTHARAPQRTRRPSCAQLFLSHYIFNKKAPKKTVPADNTAFSRSADAANKARPLTETKRD